MLMVIFGAGASADSINPDVLPFDAAQMPPTAARLFTYRDSFDRVLRTEFPVAVSAVQQLRERIAKGASMEMELARLQAEAEDYEDDRRALVAIRFYIQRVISDASEYVARQELTNYRSLARTLDKWRHGRGEPILYVTFNYDSLLEQGLMTALEGVQFLRLDDYWGNDRANVVKLHGSVDWWHPTVRGIWPKQQDVRGPFINKELPEGAVRRMRLDFINEVTPEDVRSEIFETGFPDRFYGDAEEDHLPLYFPAIAIPVEKKSHFECPADHIDRLVRLLPSVDRILTVGWRAQEEHFLDLLTEHLPARVETLVVTSAHNTAVEVFKRLREHYKDRPRDREWFQNLDREWAEGFSGLVTSRALPAFLDREVGVAA